MKQRTTTGKAAGGTRRRKPANVKRHAAPAARRHRGSSVADLQARLEHFRLDLKEAREQQAATSEVLKCISSSPADLEPVFAAMLENATRLCEANFGVMFRYDQGRFRVAAMRDLPRRLAGYLQQDGGFVQPPPPGSVLDRVLRTKKVAHTADGPSLPNPSPAATFGGARSQVAVPMLRDNELVGAFVIYRQKVRPFTDRQIELVKNFATQAVIAIENTRLLNELREALSQQTTTSDVLKVISRSAFDLQSVLDTLVESAGRLCRASSVGIRLARDGVFHHVASYGMPADYVEYMKAHPARAEWSSIVGRVALEARAIQIADVRADAELTMAQDPAVPTRTVLGVPLLRDGCLVGVLLTTRTEVEPFTERQIELVRTFADQAVIAIENVRLFQAEQQRTAELSESLEQQTATSEVLKVISSSPGELEPVFNAILENATRICEAQFGNLLLREGDGFRAVAVHGETTFAERRREQPKIMLRDHPDLPVARLLKTKAAVHVADFRLERAYIERRHAPTVELVEIGGARTFLAVPMLKDEELVGAIVIYRTEVRPFTDKQIELVSNFAAQAVIAIENTRLLNELRRRTGDLTEALEQQTATSEVLKVISGSPGDLQPVFDVLLVNATRMCGAKFGALSLREGDAFRSLAMIGAPPAFADQRQRDPVIRPTPGHNLERLLRTRDVVHIPDLETDKAAAPVPYELAGARAALNVPLLKDGEVTGSLLIYRQEKGSFSAKQIELVQNFAAQAVIAIENTRLLNELRQRTDDLSESLEQQTATSEVLKVISGSPGELEPVFRAMLAHATRICDAGFGNLLLSEGKGFRRAAFYGGPPEWSELRVREPIVPPGAGDPLDRVVSTRRLQHMADIRDEPLYRDGYPPLVALADVAGARTLVMVPMLKEGELVGTIAIYRLEVRPFTDKQIELVQNFAHQAVIAIENARLLSELRESLQQQTATADVLKVISRSTFDLQAVFKALVDSAAQLCRANRANIALLKDGGFEYYAAHGFDPEYMAYMRSLNLKADRGSVIGRAALEGRVIHVHDVLGDPEYAMLDAQKRGGFRTALGVPLLREGMPIGAMFLSRDAVEPFAPQQIDLVSTFAAQAVIAIENTRLLGELRQSLEQQTATANVLKVISSSPGELEPVFNAMLENATRICGAKFASLYLYDGDLFHVGALHNAPPAFAEARRREPTFRPHPGTGLGKVAATLQTFHIADMTQESGYIERDPVIVAGVELGGFRTVASVPMLKDGKLVGCINIYRQEVRPFTDKQIELVQNFAAQAVIAIENTRLLNELRESLQRQTATADVLKVISRSTFDLQTVLQTLIEAAARLCEADQGSIARRQDGVLVREASHGFSPEFAEYIKNLPVELQRGSASGRALLEGRTVHIPDVQADAEYTFAEARKLGGFRTILTVPMMREGNAIGMLVLTRTEVRPFTDKQIALVETFADQAAIAIENVRLFESVEARTRELARSLEDLQTAQDRLVQTQKLASLGQLTAGIAHEIKNPLNFVNNFSAISTEMLEELEQALERVQSDTKTRSEIEELTGTLRGNLDKIVHHGKRADSIVKNMLLHSREGSGEHRPVDINAVVEESLNLAYHGARAEKQGFNITLERSFDPVAGMVDVFPQEITRVLLNLISNGFYAATRRKSETADGSYEPALAAATRDLGDRVEIRIRDNGTGIPPEVKDRMFNPFFTTKPPGEGTGLGLSLSHDIIVKQHAGTIEVDSEPGQYTEFRIVLPRRAASIAKSGGPA